MNRQQQQHDQTANLFDRLIPGLSEIQADLRRAADQITTLAGVHSQGLQPRPLTLNQNTGAATSQLVATSANTLRGWSLRENAGGLAVVRLRNGRDAGADILLTISFAAAESVRDFPTHGIAFTTGLYCEIVTGSIEGTLFVGPVGA